MRLKPGRARDRTTIRPAAGLPAARRAAGGGHQTLKRFSV